MSPGRLGTEQADWEPEQAEAIAARAGRSLGPDHWRVIGCAREHWASTGRAPDLEQLARASRLGADRLRALFGPDPAAAIAELAGVRGAARRSGAAR